MNVSEREKKHIVTGIKEGKREKKKNKIKRKSLGLLLNEKEMLVN